MTRPKSNTSASPAPQPASSRPAIDLDVLRGWREQRDPALARPHRLSALASLHQLDPAGDAIATYSVFGPSILLGRFHSQHSPVDLLLDNLQDHQTYRLGSPHAHLELLPIGQWVLQALAPQSPTLINGQIIETLANAREVRHGDHITLGVTTFRFEPHDISLDHHQDELEDLLETCEGPALFLSRSGAPCGPFAPLNPEEPLTLGRTYPAAGILPNSQDWPPLPAHIWDLSGLPEVERKFVAFQHARIIFRRNHWHIEPLSARQRTYVNRIPINAPTLLEPGDEIALGSALFHFQLPESRSLPRRTITPPLPVDWNEGRPPAEDPER